MNKEVVQDIGFEKAYQNIYYIIFDINCRLEIFLKNDRSSFFDNISDWKNLIVKENNMGKTNV